MDRCFDFDEEIDRELEEFMFGNDADDGRSLDDEIEEALIFGDIMKSFG